MVVEPTVDFGHAKKLLSAAVEVEVTITTASIFC